MNINKSRTNNQHKISLYRFYLMMITDVLTLTLNISLVSKPIKMLHFCIVPFTNLGSQEANIVMNVSFIVLHS
jgi:hypothetical protein